MPGAFHSLDMGGEEIFNLLGPISRDKGDLSDFLLGVHDIQQPRQLLAAHCWANLDPNRILDPSEIFNVRSAQLARSIADPDKVSRGVEPFRLAPVRRVPQLARQALLILEQKAFMGSVNVDSSKARGRVGADGLHEADRISDGVYYLLVLFLGLAVLDMAESPFKWVV